MTFPDQSHINRVRDALWQRSGNGASVMVGSGFSRNAERITRNAREMPTWQSLGERFYKALYPHEAAPAAEENPRPATDNLRIAQEYEAAFGRSSLHDECRRLVPDTDHIPSREHQRLLKLPWRDIYTTNWDTLLERAQRGVTEQRYNTVASVEEIPMAGRPRIVKLHGSLPAQFPLIVTEEDYRTYPTKFAPFVNTVQQSMMETVFLLIGFSGDDPNFLNWSGWVRDNLGPSAPKIYLAGWLGLSPHRRRMLENRNVVPIDLAQHRRAGEWPENLRHEYAVKWLLHTLELGEPYNVTSWPAAPSRQSEEIPMLPQPVEAVTPNEPKPERRPVSDETIPSPEEVRGITAIWRHNRLIYPGWLTMPLSQHRRNMEGNTEKWNDTIIVSLPTMNPVERLSALRELVWRKEILLMPMYPDLQAAIQSTLGTINCRERQIGGAVSHNEDWAAIREDWRNVAATLVTAARFQCDARAFEEAVERLEPFQDEDLDIRQRILHEKCLQAVYNGEFNLLGDLLTNWETENCDPTWMMRKSALLWEAGLNSEARELLNDAIAAIKAMPSDEREIANLSRESWATFVAIGPEFGREYSHTLMDRLRGLAAMRCDPFAEKRFVMDDIGRTQTEEDPPSFDINYGRSTSATFYPGYDPYAAAYRAVRMSEMAGVPPFTYALIYDRPAPLRVSQWDVVLKKAAEEVCKDNSELAVRLMLRACSGDSDKTLGHVLTRARVATIPTETAKTLVESSLKIIEASLSDNVTRASASQRRFSTATEILSRLAIRLESDQVEAIFERAVNFCQSAQIAKVLIDTPIRNLLTRSWEALPEGRRQSRAMDLLVSEMVGINNVEPFIEAYWPDPAEMIEHTNTKILRTPDNESKWQSAVDLIARGLAANPTARHRAARRMMPLIRSNLLAEEETLRIAAALWSDQYTKPDGLPEDTKLYDWAFLMSPEPIPGIAEQRFREKWFSHDEDNAAEILSESSGFEKSRLWQIGMAIQELRKNGHTLTLAQTDLDRLANLLERWTDELMPEVHRCLPNIFWLDFLTETVQQIAKAMSAIMSEIPVPQTLGSKIYTMMQELTANHLPAFALTAGLVKTQPGKTLEVAAALRMGLVSDNKDLASDAFLSLYQWVKDASDSKSKAPSPPDDLIHEVGRAIATRRSAALATALDVAILIFKEGQAEHKEAIQEMVADGLRYLSDELRYDREHEDPEEVPRRRLYCAELAMAMTESGIIESPAVQRWLEIAREDPLPEVRQAVEKPETGQR